MLRLKNRFFFEVTDAAVLRRGARHSIKSVTPSFADNSVIAGHRDSVFKGHLNKIIGNPTDTLSENNEHKEKLDTVSNENLKGTSSALKGHAHEYSKQTTNSTNSNH
jgi:hypothetical protein